MINIAAMSSQIEIYEQMHALSTHMVEAARSNDWDRLVNLERDVAALRATLMTGENSSRNSLEPGEIEKKRRLIQYILRDDAEVRRHTEPWMERICELLGAGRRHDAPQACGSEAGEASPGGA